MSRPRKWAFVNALAYYAAGLWPMIPAACHFAPIPGAMLMWAVSAVLLSTPWALARTTERGFLSMSPLILAQVAGMLPPLGLIGFISPLTGAGYLFPGTGWVGLIATALLPGVILLARHNSTASQPFRLALLAVFALGVGSHLLNPTDARPPAGWEAVNTDFGDVSKPYQQFVAAHSIQQRAAASSARVLIFPEAVIPRWSDATTEFLQQTLTACRERGQILAIGAGLARKPAIDADAVKSYDFNAAIQALRSDDGQSPPESAQIERQTEPFDNTLLVLGAESSTFYQRVPVPIGMWQPFDKSGVPLHLNAPATVRIGDQRVAVLICYEQILTYPVLTAMLERPTVLVGISNTYWIAGTPIPRHQRSALHGWARLFGLPYLLAVNS
jgi:apolipoprotein N-acyltransferase